jgi:acyl-CoA thioester hydrolase
MHTNVDNAAASTRFTLGLRIYYEDTDAAGVVYYANYLCFCERARTEWLRSLGYQQRELMTRQRIAFVVRSVNADYLSPAVFDDELNVVSTIGRLSGASILFEQKILRGEELLFKGQFLIACVNLDKKRPTPLPAELRAKLEKLVQV